MIELETKVDELRVGIYCRVSTREQAIEGYSIDSQRRKNSDYLDLYEIQASHVEYYIDDGYSAKNLNRPGMKQMMQDVVNNKLDMIIIYKLDRIARNVSNTYELLKLFIDHNCNLVAFIDHLDIQSANGRLLVGILAIIAQWESESIAERVGDALVQMCEEGQFPYGYTPFGTKKVENRLYIDEDDHQILKIMCELAKCGLTARDISHEIYEKYHVYKSDKAVKRILSKPYNAGEFEYQGKKYYDIVPKLLDKKDIEYALKTMRKRTPAIKNYQFYFGNSVRCSCGSVCSCRVTTKKTHRIFYYYCEQCNKRINQNKLLRAVLYSLFDHAKKSKYNQQQKKLINKLNYLLKKSGKIYDEYVSGKVNDKVYAFTASKLEDERTDILNQLDVLQIKALSSWDSMTDRSRYNFIHLNLKYLVCDTEMHILNNVEFK